MLDKLAKMFGEFNKFLEHSRNCETCTSAKNRVVNYNSLKLDPSSPDNAEDNMSFAKKAMCNEGRALFNAHVDASIEEIYGPRNTGR